MKKMIFVFLAAAALGASPFPASAQPGASGEAKPPSIPPGHPTLPAKPKVVIGYVDVRKLALGSKSGDRARQELQEKSKKLETQVKNREKALETLRATLEKQAATMTPEQKRAKAQEFEKKVKEFQEFLKKSEKEMASKDEELTRKVVGEVRKAAKTYGEREGLAAILSGNDLLYGGNDVDLKDVTEDVAKLMDSPK